MPSPPDEQQPISQQEMPSPPEEQQSISQQEMPSQPDEQQPISQQEEETSQPQQQLITEEEYNEYSIREKQIRSKILNRKRPFQCNIKNQDEEQNTIFIEKVSLKTSLTDMEEKISNIIKQQRAIHPFLYFQPVIETTPLSINTINMEQLESCEEDETEEIIHSAQDQTQDAVLLSLKYKKIATNDTNQSLQDFLRTQKTHIKPKNKFLPLLISSHMQLLESVKILQTIDPQIIHFNLTDQTILYDNVNAIPVITDFRMAFTTEEIENIETFQSFIPAYEDYPAWPIEIFMLSKLIDAKTETCTEEMIMYIMQEFGLTSFFMDNQEQFKKKIDEFENNIAKFLQQFLSKTTNEIMNMVKQYATTWDTYAISIYMIHLINELQIPQSYSFIKRYMETLYKVVLSDPGARPDITSITIEITDIFKGIDKQEYYAFVDELIIGKSAEDEE